MYKMVEIMINKRMVREEKENDIKKLNVNQIGFQKGLGCEINILKLIQKLKYWKIIGKHLYFRSENKYHKN